MAEVDEQERPFARTQGKHDLRATMALVGIGVGMASLRSLEQLFAGLDAKIGAAYLVGVRQQEGLNVDAVIEAVKRQSPFGVEIAADGKLLEPNHVYVGGPDDMITIVDGHLRTRPAVEPIGHRGTVDTMLISLAEHAHDRSVTVILAGLGTDGTAGLTATKKFGGLSIAELTPDGHEDAPGGVGPAPVADLHLPIDKIATAIALYAGNLAPSGEGDGQDEVAKEIEAQITQITTVLRNVTSHDFHGYKRGTFVRRIQRRIQVLQIGGVDAYVTRLRSDRDEVQNLFQDLLIGVTQFFRDPAEFNALERELPRLFEGKTTGDQLRVWVLGCATGEEAYSIAILLREKMAALDHPPEAQIFATDLDARALSLARAGRYAADAIAGHVRPDRLKRWFQREGDTYCVSKELREMCIFSPHNIVKDAPFSRIDILSCRNLLIYLNTDLQNRVIPIFHFSLRTGGLLFLGSSENVSRHQKLFAPADRKNRVFHRLETATRVIPDFPLTPRPRPPQPSEFGGFPAAEPGRLTKPISRRAEAIAERYAPAYVLVDTQGDVLQFSGRTGRYLEPAAGAATLNLLNLVNRDLRLDLRSALARAVAESRPIELPRLQLTREDRTHIVNVMVEPVDTGDVTSLIVLFQDAGVAPEGTMSGDRLSSDEQVQRLEAELRLTRDRLQATIEELESTNEELKSSNEEYQSINEELQSASEEMETSKEELQSINEELHTVNGELGHRVTELAASNSDIKNLLESTQIATVFLDNDLRIRSFTPTMADIFHLLENDVGRPLHHVVSRVHYPELSDDIRRVLKTLVPVERSVVDAAADTYYAARVLPYRRVDNYIGGTVVTFTNVTAVRRAEAALRETEARYRDELEIQVQERTAELKQSRDLMQATMDASMDMIQVFEAVRDGRGEIVDFRWLLNNHSVTSSYGDIVGQSLLERNPGVVEEGIFEAFKGVIETGQARRDDRYYVHEQFDGWFHQSVVKLGDGVATTTMDITERKKAEAEILRLRDEVAQAKLRESEERLQKFGEASQDVLWIREAETLQWEYLTPAFEAIYGLDRASALRGDNMAGWADLIVPEDRDYAVGSIGRVRDGESVTFEYRIRRPLDGEIRWLRNTDFPIKDEAGRVVRIGGIGHDITELKKTAEALAAAEQRQRALLEGIPQLVWRAVDGGEWTWASPQWIAYTGQLDADSHGWGWLNFLHPDDHDIARAAWAKAAETGGFEVECRIRGAAPESYRWFQTRAVPLRDAAGEIVEWLGTSTDVHDLRQLQDEQKVMVAELQHRTRNLMGVVRSLAETTIRSSSSLDEFGPKFRDRIGALARVQGLLSRLKDVDRVTFDELIRAELTAIGGDHADRVTLNGPGGIPLRSSTVQTFALALHELATNAVKYGALGQPDGRLAISWRVEPSAGEGGRPWLHVDWVESGVAMLDAATPEGGGAGRTLIERALPYQLGAKTTFVMGPDGVRCSISLPVSDETVFRDVPDVH